MTVSLEGLCVGPYRIGEALGAGAMGEVFLAHDDALGRKVAVKLLAEEHRDNEELRARFLREARASAAVTHPNVVKVYTVGEVDGRPYLAMEFLSGTDLATHVDQCGPMDSRAAMHVLAQAAAGLEAAANAGLVHRDVKPSNLMRLESGTIKVTDFGLAKPVGADVGPALTALGVVLGTPDYIAPEQASGEGVDARTDVYALGCTLFHLLTGRPPFRARGDRGRNVMKIIARHLREPAPDPRREVSTVDDELADLVMAMMAKAPGERPGYPQILAAAERIRTRLAAAPAEAPRSAPTRRGSWGTRLAAAALTLAAAGGLAAFYFAQGKEPTHAASTSPDATPPAVANDPPVTAGMLLVPRDAGRPAFLVARAAVTHRQFAAEVPSHHFPPDEAERPVVGVSYDAAVAFARASERRLLRASEWNLALATSGFVPAGMLLWEWVDDGRRAGSDHAVRRVNGGTGKRPAQGKADVTFRIAMDAPADAARR